jgi:hypothetical protein
VAERHDGFGSPPKGRAAPGAGFIASMSEARRSRLARIEARAIEDRSWAKGAPDARRASGYRWTGSFRIRPVAAHWSGSAVDRLLAHCSRSSCRCDRRMSIDRPGHDRHRDREQFERVPPVFELTQHLPRAPAAVARSSRRGGRREVEESGPLTCRAKNGRARAAIAQPWRSCGRLHYHRNAVSDS